MQHECMMDRRGKRKVSNINYCWPQIPLNSLEQVRHLASEAWICCIHMGAGRCRASPSASSLYHSYSLTQLTESWRSTTTTLLLTLRNSLFFPCAVFRKCYKLPALGSAFFFPLPHTTPPPLPFSSLFHFEESTSNTWLEGIWALRKAPEMTVKREISQGERWDLLGPQMQNILLLKLKVSQINHDTDQWLLVIESSQESSRKRSRYKEEQSSAAIYSILAHNEIWISITLKTSGSSEDRLVLDERLELSGWQLNCWIKVTSRKASPGQWP